MITSFQSLLLAISHLMALIIPILVALALLYFFWGLALFIMKAGDEKAVIEGKSKMIWGVVALFVMVSVWGLVAVFQSNLITGANPTNIPINSKSLNGSTSGTGGTGNGFADPGDDPDNCADSCGY